VAAGDIACEPGERPSRDECGQQVTADLVTGLNPNAVLALGDTQYEDATPDEFAAYDESWGRFKDITLPVVGNHEYQTPDAKGYYAYFGDRAGEPGKGWYTTTVATWRVIVLNDDHNTFDGVAHALAAVLPGVGSSKVSSRTRSLERSPVVGGAPGAGGAMGAAAEGGRRRRPERPRPRLRALAPQTPTETLGPVEFVVGTAAQPRGFSHTSGRSPCAGRLVRRAGDDLRADGYDWRFVGPRAPAVDSGTGTCRVIDRGGWLNGLSRPAPVHPERTGTRATSRGTPVREGIHPHTSRRRSPAAAATISPPAAPRPAGDQRRGRSACHPFYTGKQKIPTPAVASRA
jgi:hypothetical protein